MGLQALCGRSGKVEEQRAPPRGVERQVRRRSQQGGAEGIGDDETGLLGNNSLGKELWNREVEGVAVLEILRPLPIGTEVLEARFNLDDDDTSFRIEADHINPAPGTERELRKGRIAQIAEHTADAARQIDRQPVWARRGSAPDGGSGVIVSQT